MAGAVFNGLLAVVGGEQPTSTFSEIEAFDPDLQKWITLPRLPTGRHGIALAVIANKMYVLGGGKRPGLSVSGENEVLEVNSN